MPMQLFSNDLAAIVAGWIGLKYSAYDVFLSDSCVREDSFDESKHSCYSDAKKHSYGIHQRNGLDPLLSC